MRQQATGLVFCALIFFSFGNELLTRQRPDQRSKKSAQLTRHEPVSSSQNTVNSPLQILINSRSNLLGLLNVTSEVGMVDDVNRGYKGIFDGSSGWIIVINLETRIGVFIPNNLSSRGWFSSSQSFEDYFRNLTSLEPLYQIGLKSGNQFGPKNISRYISVQLQLTINAFSGNEFSVTRCEAFDRLIEYSTIIIETVKGPLNGIVNIVGDSVIPTSYNYRAIPALFQGLASIFSKVEGGVSVLRNIRLDWYLVFNSETACRVLIYILSQLSAHNIDVRPILAQYSNNYLTLLNQFGGNSTKGVNGIVRIVSEIRLLSSGQSSIQSLLKVLIEYFGHPGNRVTTYEKYREEALNLLDFVQKLQLTSELKGLVECIRSTLDGNYRIKGINYQEIVKICSKSSSAPPLHRLVQILENIRTLVKIEVSTGVLLYRLIVLTLYGAVDEVLGLVPAIKIDYTVDVHTYIFHDVKINDLKENLYKFLSSLRVFGPILEVIDNSLRSFSYITFDDIFKGPDFRPYKQIITKLLDKVTRSSNVLPHNVEIEDDKQLNAHQRRHESFTATQEKHLAATKKEFMAHGHTQDSHTKHREAAIKNRFNSNHLTKHRESGMHHGNGKRHEDNLHSVHTKLHNNNYKF